MFPKEELEVTVKVTGSLTRRTPSGLGLPLPVQIFVIYQMAGISKAAGKIQNRNTQGSPRCYCFL